jgi:hypothetical protein
MDNIIFEDPSKYKPRLKNPCRVFPLLKERGSQSSMKQTQEQKGRYIGGNNHEHRDNSINTTGITSLHDLFTLDSDDNDDSSGCRGSEDDLLSLCQSGNKQSSESDTSIGSAPDKMRSITPQGHSAAGGDKDQVITQPTENFQAVLDRRPHKRSRRALPGARSVVFPEKESVSDSDDSQRRAGNGTSSDDADSKTLWEYKYIVARQVDSRGRQMALVRWKDTWELESEIEDLETALRVYAKREGKREGKQQRNSKMQCLNRGTRKRKFA